MAFYKEYSSSNTQMDGNRVVKESEKSEKAAMPKGIIALSQVGTPIKAAILIPNKAQYSQ